MQPGPWSAPTHSTRPPLAPRSHPGGAGAPPAGIRPLGHDDMCWATRLLVDRLSASPGWRLVLPPGLRRPVLGAHVRGCLAGGQGWTDGRAVALLEPPGARSPSGGSGLVAGASLAAVGVVAALGCWVPWAGTALGILAAALALARWWPAFPALRLARRSRPAGSAWLHGLAKPAGDPHRSASPLLEGLLGLADASGWVVALETDHRALVARYAEMGFQELATARAPWGERVVMARQPASA